MTNSDGGAGGVEGSVGQSADAARAAQSVIGGRRLD
jgi:hypothetical protein